MLNMIQNKIRQNRGASLTFALLLFLVCAVVGSVVLASATAAAGRASENYEYDQRYFSVTSAADLLRKTLDGQSVTVTVTKNVQRTEITTITTDANGQTVTQHSVSDAAPTYELDDGRLSNDTSNLLVQTATAFLDEICGGALDQNAEALFTANTLALTKPKDLPELALTVSASGNGAPNTAGLAAKITPTLQPDGSLVLVVENATGDEADHYRLQVTLTATITTGTSTAESHNDSRSGTETEDFTTTRTDVYDVATIKTITITWKVTGVGKAV